MGLGAGSGAVKEEGVLHAAPALGEDLALVDGRGQRGRVEGDSADGTVDPVAHEEGVEEADFDAVVGSGIDDFAHVVAFLPLPGMSREGVGLEGNVGHVGRLVVRVLLRGGCGLPGRRLVAW